MVKANEFRLGNYCQDKLTGELLKVFSLSTEDNGVGFYVFDRSKYPLPDGWSAEPIPLTEEWLNRFGLSIPSQGPVKVMINRRLFNLYKNLMRDGSGLYKGYSLCMKTQDDMTAHVFIEYVHQFQNLIFALTGEEFTIKEKV